MRVLQENVAKLNINPPTVYTVIVYHFSIHSLLQCRSESDEVCHTSEVDDTSFTSAHRKSELLRGLARYLPLLQHPGPRRRGDRIRAR